MKKSKHFMFQEEQEGVILQSLKKYGHITVDDVIKLTGVSASTARIRLNSMQERGLLVRTHGGAVHKDGVIVPHDITSDVPFLEEKKAVARAARRTIADGDIIALGGGNTTLLLAKELHGVANLTVVTTSVCVANELLGDPNIEVRICGGVLRARTGICYGAQAEKFFQNIIVTKSYFSMDSIDVDHGFTTMDTDSRSDVALVQCGKDRYALADHSKLSVGPFIEQLGTLDEMHALIIDEGADPEVVGQLRAKGLNVILAEIP